MTGRKLPEWYADAIDLANDVYAGKPEGTDKRMPKVIHRDSGVGVSAQRKGEMTNKQPDVSEGDDGGMTGRPVRNRRGRAASFHAPPPPPAGSGQGVRENAVISNPQSVREIVSPVVRFGGKARAAPLVWAALGDPNCFIDPFAGSLAVPLRAPQPLKKVVINDIDDLLVNFWRALQWAPDAVAYWADYPTSHTDLIARREFLRQQWPHVRRVMKSDPTWYDARLAGWWAWAVSNSIDLLRLEFPSDGSQTWYRETTGAGADGAVAHAVQLDARAPVVCEGDGAATAEIADDRLFPDDPTPFSGDRLTPWLSDLARKIQRWILLCKDWRDVVSSRSITSTTGTQPGTICGIFLDPPYNRKSIDRGTLYSAEDFDIADDVFEWLTTPDARYGKEGDNWTPWENPQLRIVLCGYDNDYRTRELPRARVVNWRRGGGMERTATLDGKDKKRQEILVLSPACLPVQGEYAADGTTAPSAPVQRDDVETSASPGQQWQLPL